MEVDREDIRASGDSVAAVIGHGGEGRAVVTGVEVVGWRLVCYCVARRG